MKEKSMKPIFIIEGADKCGKSQLCKYLIDTYKCNYIHNGKYRNNPFENYIFEMEIFKNIEGNPPLILDRYVLSNYVYSHVYQDGEKPLKHEILIAFKNHFERVARNHGYIPIWIVCSPDYTTWRKTYLSSVSEGNEMYTDIGKMEEVYKMMSEEAAYCDDMEVFDWTRDPEYKHLQRYIKFCLNMNSRTVSALNHNTVQIADLMSHFRFLKDAGEETINGTYEILNYGFVFDPMLDIEFPGYKINREYHERELKWYLSLDRSIKGWMEDIKIWNDIASKDDKREINSNYGWCCFSVENGSQYSHVLETLKKDENSRQAEFIYTRPNIHTDWNKDGRHDFICTNTVQIFIRDNRLHYKIDQRSLDTITGLKADWYWHEFVYKKLLHDLQETYPNLKPGIVLWNVGSCHIYERSFKILDKITGVAE